jgi:hypothetical protein
MTPEEIEKRTDELARRSAKPNNPEVKGKLDHWVAAWPKLRSKRSNGEKCLSPLKHWRSTKNDDRRNHDDYPMISTV